MKYERKEVYPENTVGAYMRFCDMVFGMASPATQHMEDRARRSPNGFYEPMVAPETEIMKLLAKLHNEGTDE